MGLFRSIGVQGQAQIGMLTVVDNGIDTHQKPMVYMRRDCEVYMAERFTASTRLGLEFQDQALIAILNVVDHAVLPQPIAYGCHYNREPLGMLRRECRLLTN